MVETGEPSSEGAPPPCSVVFCPIAMTLSATGEVRPELVQHLLAAGREVMLAVRAIIDARLGETEPPPRLERIRIE